MKSLSCSIFALVLMLLFVSAVSAIAQTLSLYDAIQKALENNKTILYAAEQSYGSALAQRRAAESAYNPNLNTRVSLSRSFSRTKHQSLIGSDDLYEINQFQQFYPNVILQQTLLTPFGSKLTLSGGLQTLVAGISSFSYQTQPSIGFLYQQPLSFSGIESGHSDIVQAELSFQQAELNYQLLKEQLALSVIQSYYQLWQAERNVEQSKRDAESAQSILDIAEMKLKHGSIAEFEVLNLRVQHRLAEDNLLQSQNNLESQSISFLRILGNNSQSLDSIITLEQGINIDSINFTLNEAFERAIEHRLELRQAETSLVGAKLNREQVSSSYSPSLQINAEYSRSSKFENIFFHSFIMSDYRWNVYGTISIPLFDGGRTHPL